MVAHSPSAIFTGNWLALSHAKSRHNEVGASSRLCSIVLGYKLKPTWPTPPDQLSASRMKT
jgi:hypothetical protein